MKTGCLNGLIAASRSSDPVTRKKFIHVTEAVKQKGGEVLIFSSMHESGQRTDYYLYRVPDSQMMVSELNQLTGIAAILTFPLDIAVVEAEEREAEEERERQEEQDQLVKSSHTST